MECLAIRIDGRAGDTNRRHRIERLAGRKAKDSEVLRVLDDEVFEAERGKRFFFFALGGFQVKCGCLLESCFIELLGLLLYSSVSQWEKKEHRLLAMGLIVLGEMGGSRRQVACIGTFQL